MVDHTDDDQLQRANIFYLTLQHCIEQPVFDDMKAFIPSNVIPAGELEKCDSFTKLCERLTRKQVISPKNNDYLKKMFKTVERYDLRTKVIEFDKPKKISVFLPTCLYSNAMLPIDKLLEDILPLLETTNRTKGPDAIPQLLTYANAAAGIARPEKDVILEVQDKVVVVNIPEGAVTEAKVLYCHFVESAEPCLLQIGQPLVCYSLPVCLGPFGEKFYSQPVLLKVAHNAARPRSSTLNIRLFVRRLEEEVTWKEEKRFCLIEKDIAIIQLTHFSEFVIGVDPSTTTSLPSLRARMITSVRNVSETERTLSICLVFDSAYMITKAEELLPEKEGAMLDVDMRHHEIILEPRVSCKIQIEGKRWTASDQLVEDVTLDEMDMLVFSPISREITLVQNENTDVRDSRMCNVVITQSTLSQEFAVSDDTLSLSKPKEDETSTEYTEVRPEDVGVEKSWIPGAAEVGPEDVGVEKGWIPGAAEVGPEDVGVEKGWIPGAAVVGSFTGRKAIFKGPTELLRALLPHCRLPSDLPDYSSNFHHKIPH